MVKERCFLLTDFWEQGSFFFQPPASYDVASIQPKWNNEKTEFFRLFTEKIKELPAFEAVEIETCFKALATQQNIKAGELQLPLRIMLVGGKFGPPVYEIAATIGLAQTIQRIEKCLEQLT